MNINKINTQMNFYKSRQQKDKQQFDSNNNDKENSHTLKLKKRYLKSIQKLVFQERMKNIVAENVDYFRHILQPKQFYKPNDKSLRLPDKMLKSLYRQQFQNRKPYQTLGNSVDRIRMEVNPQASEIKVSTQTTYQNEYKHIKLDIFKQRIKSKTKNELLIRKYKSNKAPHFLQTHNNLQYKNWGSPRMMPSMKPQQIASTTNTPFKGCSTYQNEFHSVLIPKTKLIKHEQTYPQNMNLWMGKSSYDRSFLKNQKKGREVAYRPHEECSATNLPFMSTTIYKESFAQKDRCRANLSQQKPRNLNNKELQKLVLNL